MSDLQDSHRQHSVECFNRVWALLDQAERTAEEDQLMCEMAHASLFHWLRRDDKTAGNESIGPEPHGCVHASVKCGRTRHRSVRHPGVGLTAGEKRGQISVNEALSALPPPAPPPTRGDAR